MNIPNQKKSFIARKGWIIGIILLIATIIMQAIFWYAIPVFLNLFKDFGAVIPPIMPYYKVVSVIMALAELVLILIIISLFLVENSKLYQFVKWFFIFYVITLPIILIRAIVILYSPIFVMGNVVG